MYAGYGAGSRAAVQTKALSRVSNGISDNTVGRVSGKLNYRGRVCIGSGLLRVLESFAGSDVGSETLAQTILLE